MPSSAARTDPADLAPGDRRSAGYDWTGAVIHHIRSVEHPWFERAYDCLWAEFGGRAEMEQHGVIEARLAWDPRRPIAGHALLYEVVAVEREGALCAVRDHTAILRPPETRARDARPDAVVHLSHAWVAPAHRRTGLAGWLRTLPLSTARDCAALAGAPIPSAIDLVAEMDPPDPADPSRTQRLVAYERAGFRKLDPSTVRYLQPDFRPPEVIDATGVEPLPLVLVVRRVGADAEDALPGDEVRAIVSALYLMYGQKFRESDMTSVWQRFETLPCGDEPVSLVAPTAVADGEEPA
jgi:hypothetical protein